MKYSDLPLYPSLEQTSFITFDQDNQLTIYPVVGVLQEQQDWAIVQLVLGRISPDNTLFAHINDSALHTPVNDGSVSDSSTWSSSQIDSAIAGSDPWFSLDSIPEGTVNLYFTQERALEIIQNTTQGIPQVDHETIAGHLTSMLLGFNSTSFRYDAENPDNISISVDGQPATIDYFEVTPGEHDIVMSTDNQDFRCNQLGHQTRVSSGLQTVTPQLTLDSFSNGVTNKLYSDEDFSNSPILSDIDDHINVGFANFHAQINDNSSSSLVSTWSSKKIITQFLTEFNRINPLTSHKELAVMHERASSGNMPGSYSWTTDDLNPGHTHYIKRYTSDDNWNENISTSTDEWWLDPGVWYVYWQVSEDINPYFTNLTNVHTYMSFDNDPRTPILQHPGVISVTNRTNYTLVTAFTTDTDYSSTYRNDWLVPRSIPGVDELYGIIHIERIR